MATQSPIALQRRADYNDVFSTEITALCQLIETASLRPNNCGSRLINRVTHASLIKMAKALKKLSTGRTSIAEEAKALLRITQSGNDHRMSVVLRRSIQVVALILLCFAT